MNMVGVAREAAVQSAEVHCTSCFDGTVRRLRVAATTDPSVVITLFGLDDYVDGLVSSAVHEAEAGEDL